jgi:hypothetical protein
VNLLVWPLQTQRLIQSGAQGVFRISPFDRRCVLFNCSPCFVGNEDYFRFLQNYRRQPHVIRAFYQYLRDHVDLPENFQFQYNRPKTDFYREQQKLCIGPLDQFISSLIVEFESNRLLAYRMGLTTLKFKQSSLWKMFQKFIEISGERFEVPLCSPNLILLCDNYDVVTLMMR